MLGRARGGARVWDGGIHVSTSTRSCRPKLCTIKLTCPRPPGHRRLPDRRRGPKPSMRRGIFSRVRRDRALSVSTCGSMCQNVVNHGRKRHVGLCLWSSISWVLQEIGTSLLSAGLPNTVYTSGFSYRFNRNLCSSLSLYLGAKALLFVQCNSAMTIRCPANKTAVKRQPSRFTWSTHATVSSVPYPPAHSSRSKHKKLTASSATSKRHRALLLRR